MRQGSNKWSPQPFIDYLYEEAVRRHDRTYDESWRVILTSRLQECLGDFSNLQGELRSKTLESVECEGYVRRRVELSICDSLNIPIYVLVPNVKTSSKLPVVLAVHGHGYGSKEIVGLHPSGMENLGDPGIHKNFAIELVRKGMIVVAPELIGFGDLKLEGDQTAGTPTDNSCFPLASQLLLLGKTLAGLRIFECSRILDYINSLDEADNNRIGCMGLSGGGLVAAYTAALDDRIKATVISGYTNRFYGSIMSRRHCLDNYIPGILKYAEMPELIGLIAPRKLFIEAGNRDHLFPLAEVKVAFNRLQEIYQSFDAETALSADFFSGGHEINGEKSYDWLVDNL